MAIATSSGAGAAAWPRCEHHMASAPKMYSACLGTLWGRIGLGVGSRLVSWPGETRVSLMVGCKGRWEIALAEV